MVKTQDPGHASPGRSTSSVRPALPISYTYTSRELQLALVVVSCELSTQMSTESMSGGGYSVVVVGTQLSTECMSDQTDPYTADSAKKY